MYRRAMEDNISKGYAVMLTEEEAATSNQKTWYLLHHGVESPNKPGRIRVVFDAASSFGGTLLNQELLQGPDINNSLVGVLARFRENPIAIVADIEAMFMQFKVPADDADALRFLWSQDSEAEPKTYRMTRHIFGATDSPSICTYGLKRCALDNEADFDPMVAATVLRSFYMDDLYKSTAASIAIRLALQLIEMLDKAHLTLTKFVSNSLEVLKAIPESRRATGCKDLMIGCDLPTERALGITWDVASDTLSVKVAEMNQPNTRRGCLSDVSSLYDPLKMVGPVTLPAKRILKMTSKLNVGWDEQLPDVLLSSWLKWKVSLRGLGELRIPRCYFPEETPVSIELHHFGDASEVGYGTVSYLRKVKDDGTAHCSFVMAKGRTAPSVFVSVPRLELQAAVVASRVDRLIRRELDVEVDRVVFWTDSRITLQYIRNESMRFKTYVANRVTEIRDSSRPDQWRHVPGKDNPADDISRGQSVFMKCS
ncbi:uncharacterized protein LOC135488575 [Lineus longissimus]|uniref:uncharacterized protein LOC135488575 n=1 Tax=Lineus longissimus TaxID=88925 RepID=UPI00315D0E01